MGVAQPPSAVIEKNWIIAPQPGAAVPHDMIKFPHSGEGILISCRFALARPLLRHGANGNSAPGHDRLPLLEEKE